MHGDRAYWASGVAAVAPGVTITGTAISDANLAVASTCTTATATPADCTPILLAAYDVQNWAQNVNTMLPNEVTTIVCTNAVTSPVLCTITITWSENMVGLNNQGTNGAGMQAPTYVLYVEP